MMGIRNGHITEESRTPKGSESGTTPAVGKSTLVQSLPTPPESRGDAVQRQASERSHAASTAAPGQATPYNIASLFGRSTSGQGASASGAALTPDRSQSPDTRLATNARPSPAPGNHADEVARIEYIYETAHATASGVLTTLAAGYVAARDQCDVAAVAEIGGRILGAHSVVHGAKSALDESLRSIPHHSVPGTEIAEELTLAQRQQAVEAKAALLPPLITVLDAVIARTLTPHVFRGKEVTAQTVAVSLDGSPMQSTAKLTGELQRTVGMLILVDEIKNRLLADKKGINRTNLQTVRTRLVPWASRPLDIAFLKAVLGPIWDLLDATADGPLDSKPSSVLRDANKQATHSGWLGDIGTFDVNEACSELRIGSRENVEFVIRQLYTADPDARARLLIQIKDRGLLDALCSAVGWTDIKDLHDSLGAGFSEIKSDLQRYFIGKRGYGPGIGHEWEHHDSSLHGLVGRLGGVGTVFNFALDVGTFGFNSSYGKALDDRSEGRTSEREASRAKMHAAARTAAIAAVSLLTGGLADKAVRGSTATVSTARGIGAGAAGGSVGGVSALATSDSYGNYVSGDQQGFSSPDEYVKAALLGGMIGGAVGGLTQGISNRVAERYLRVPESTVLPSSNPRPVETSAAPAARNIGATDAQPANELAPGADHAAAETQAPGRATTTRQLGLRVESIDALERLENVKLDPLGDANSKPNQNHYSAARREAAGEVVARRDDGRPFSHVGDLQRAYDALLRIRNTLGREVANPPDTISERGIEVLAKKYSEVQTLLNRLGGFLNEIGQSRFPPYHAFPPGA